METDRSILSERDFDNERSNIDSLLLRLRLRLCDCERGPDAFAMLIERLLLTDRLRLCDCDRKALMLSFKLALLDMLRLRLFEIDRTIDSERLRLLDNVTERDMLRDWLWL